MFLSAAHQSSDIERALDAASHGFKAARELGVNNR
jgi:glutamate-1-semialdehyde aminotransferase